MSCGEQDRTRVGYGLDRASYAGHLTPHWVGRLIALGSVTQAAYR